MWLVPSRHGVLSRTSTFPSGLKDKRSSATGGRKRYRQRRSSLGRFLARTGGVGVEAEASKAGLSPTFRGRYC